MVAEKLITARVSRYVSGAGPSMVLEIDVESRHARPPLRYTLRRRWRDRRGHRRPVLGAQLVDNPWLLCEFS